MSFTSISTTHAVTSEEVLALRDSFEMGWIDTRPVSAQVVELRPGWDSPFVDGIRHAVRLKQSGPPWPRRHNAVSVRESGGPHPTVLRRSASDVSPEPILNTHATIITEYNREPS